MEDKFLLAPTTSYTDWPCWTRFQEKATQTILLELTCSAHL